MVGCLQNTIFKYTESPQCQISVLSLLMIEIQRRLRIITGGIHASRTAKAVLGDLVGSMDCRNISQRRKQLGSMDAWIHNRSRPIGEEPLPIGSIRISTKNRKATIIVFELETQKNRHIC